MSDYVRGDEVRLENGEWGVWLADDVRPDRVLVRTMSGVESIPEEEIAGRWLARQRLQLPVTSEALEMIDFLKAKNYEVTSVVLRNVNCGDTHTVNLKHGAQNNGPGQTFS